MNLINFISQKLSYLSHHGKTQNFFITVLAFFLATSTASALVLGVNSKRILNPAVADIMKARNFRSVRIDLYIYDDAAKVRAQVARIRANGGTVRANLFTSFRNDHTCNQDFYTMEQKAYAETRAIVDKYKDVIFDYEMFNEVTLRPETVMEVPFNSAGTSTLPYTNKPCYQTLKAVLRGMSNGIGYFKTRGYPVRIILGVVGRDFGFLTFMQQQRVFFDVVGFTIYPSSGQRSLLDDPWYGTGGPFAQLAKFNRPVQINETNCAEIYDADYDNYDMNSAKVKKCFQSYKNHIPSFFNQKLVKLESLHFYELTDDPTKTGIESRFGLMYDLTSAKTHLSIASAFAGGGLTASEKQNIINLGILTDAGINAYRNIASTATVPR